MKRTKFISITLSVALISALGLSGCGGSSAPKIEKTTTDTLSVKKQGYNAVSGKVTLDESSNSKTRALGRNQADITAYNLDDNTIYRTTSDSHGTYELSGLSDGDYQIFAENDQYAKNSLRRVTLSKGSRAVVDFSLTATGTVSGKIAGAGFVYIPGTDHISVTDDEGNFALTGVPVGTYTLMYEANHSDQRESFEVTVAAGAVTAIDRDSGFSEGDDGYGDEFGYVNTSLDLGVLELHHKGIPFRINNTRYYEESYYQMRRFISLKNSAGEAIPFEIDPDKGSIRTKDVVPAGTYTLTFSKEMSEFLYRDMDEDRIYTFSVDNVSIAMPSMNQGSRMMKIIFPITLTDAQKSTFGDIKVAEKRVTDSLTLRSVWGNNALLLFGSFKTGVEYEVKPNDAQSAILGTLKNVDDKLMFGDLQVDSIYPNSGAKDTNIDQNLFVNVEFANELDPSSVKFTLNSVEYKGKDIMFDGKGSYKDDEYRPSRANISFKHDKLEYGTNYTLTFSAKDMSGNDVSKTTTFKTMAPAIVEMEPESIEDLFDDMQMIEFNVPVDAASGIITVENLTDASATAEIQRDNHEYGYNPYEIFFRINKLTPNQRYIVTATGFKDKDGVTIPEKTTEFSTPPKMLFIPDQYSQNMNVSGEHFNHKVNLFFFGGLTDTEKTALEDNLLVKSYGQAVTPDATHPIRKLFFIEEDSGTMVSVAFTIDPETNYELVLSDASGLAGIVLPDNTKLVSFATVRKDNSVTDPNAFKVIERLQVQQPHLQEEYDETGAPSMKLISNIDIDVKIPIGNINSNESCWNRYENLQMNANDIIKNSLHVALNGEEQEMYLSNNNYWNVSENWLGNNTKMCYLTKNNYEPIASFETDYNKTYEVLLNFTNTLDSQVPTSNLVRTKTLKTDPIGTMEFGISDGDYRQDLEVKYDRSFDDPNMIMFYMHANAPMKTDNLDALFNVKVNGADFTPKFDYDRNDMNITDGISFAVPRTLYSLLQLELSRVPGQDMRFINPLTGEEVTNNSSLAEPIMFVEDVAPDLMPVTIEEVKTTSVQNNEIFVSFNRPVNPDDVAIVNDVGKVTEVAFEVKANDDTEVTISGAEKRYDGVVLTLKEDLNSSKTYTLSLKNSEEIQAAFGAQKLTEFSQDIELTYLEVGEMLIVSQQGSVSNDSASAYMMGSTDKVNADYENDRVVVLPINIADEADIDLDASRVNVKNRYNSNEIFNNGPLTYDAKAKMLIQPINNGYDMQADAKVAYSVNGQEFSLETSQDYLNQVAMPYVSYYFGDGADAITFGIKNMQNGYTITPANFVVYNELGEKIDADISIQFNMEMSSNQPTVTFGNLASKNIYAIDIIDIPSNSMPEYMINGISIDTIFIATPPAAP
jgi:hypothetical protein